MRSCLTIVLIFLAAVATNAADWPSFRGPQGNGVSEDSKAPLQWTIVKNVKWSAKLPQASNGSPIVSAGFVFVTAPEDAKGTQRSLYCFDRKSGAKVWSRTVSFEQEDPTHDTNPHGGSTPAADGKRVVVWHGSGGLYCYDFVGKELWKKDLGVFRHMWGYGSSPVIHGDRVILHSGPGKQTFIAAFNLQDGEEVWRQDEPTHGNGEYRDPQGAFPKAYMGSWATPLLTKIDGRLQVVCPMPTRVVGLDATDGKLLWWCEGLRANQGDLAYSSPVLADDICVITGGFGGPSFAFKAGGEGDITSTRRLWRKDSNPQSIGSGVAIDGYFYRPNAGANTIECIEPKTGKVLWTERAGSYWGSIVVAAGRCYVTGQDGTTVVFKPSPEKFELLAKNTLGEGSNATPAVSDGELFLRTHRTLWCIAE